MCCPNSDNSHLKVLKWHHHLTALVWLHAMMVSDCPATGKRQQMKPTLIWTASYSCTELLKSGVNRMNRCWDGRRMSRRSSVHEHLKYFKYPIYEDYIMHILHCTVYYGIPYYTTPHWTVKTELLYWLTACLIVIEWSLCCIWCLTVKYNTLPWGCLSCSTLKCKLLIIQWLCIQGTGIVNMMCYP